MIRIGGQVRRMLLAVAMSAEENEERLSAAEWEAVCTVMGLMAAFRGDLPPSVLEECYAVMAEVARRTGLPLHVVEGPRGPETRH